ncbi:hypothetical protein [Actinoallomurus oryzae]|uniref:hypothetical protein n=1 Tax=Actinoallomurus oryzae TaxID=502180 RepID=UPI0031EE64AE
MEGADGVVERVDDGGDRGRRDGRSDAGHASSSLGIDVVEAIAGEKTYEQQCSPLEGP